MPIRKEMRQRYPEDWALRSRFVRFHRAGNRCEWCGVHNYTLREDTGAVVVLTAAHVYDKRPEACGLLNLAALCQRCHLRHDAKDRAQGRRERARGPPVGAGDLKRPVGEQPAGLIAYRETTQVSDRCRYVRQQLAPPRRSSMGSFANRCWGWNY